MNAAHGIPSPALRREKGDREAVDEGPTRTGYLPAKRRERRPPSAAKSGCWGGGPKLAGGGSGNWYADRRGAPLAACRKAAGIDPKRCRYRRFVNYELWLADSLARMGCG